MTGNIEDAWSHAKKQRFVRSCRDGAVSLEFILRTYDLSLLEMRKVYRRLSDAAIVASRPNSLPSAALAPIGQDPTRSNTIMLQALTMAGGRFTDDPRAQEREQPFRMMPSRTSAAPVGAPGCSADPRGWS